MKPPIRILVVEDDADLLRATCRTLVQAGYAVGAASAGAEVLPALRQQPAQLVLLDRQLPDVDGLEICRQIKVDPALTEVFVVITSATYKGSDDRVAGLEALADGYIERPISNRELLARVEAFVRIVRLNQSLSGQAKALRASEERYRTLFNRANEGICLLSANGDLVSVNESYARMHGYRVEEMLPRNLQALNTPETAALVPAQLRRLLAGESLTFETEHYHKDGHVFPLEVSASLISVGRENFLQCFHRDITERRRAEESLRLDNQIMANMADGVCLVREGDGVIVYANDRFEKMFGYAPGELLGQPVSVVNAPASQSPEATAQTIIAELGRSGTWEGEVHNVKKDGTTFWCQARVSTFVHGLYGPVWVALSHDITARKLAEDELRGHQVELKMQNEELRRSQVELDASRARYFDLFDFAPVGYVTISKPGLIVEANVTVAGLLGVVRGALIRQLFSRFILKEDTDSYYLLRKQLFATGAPQSCELRMVNRAGTPFWVHLSATVSQDAAGAPVCRVTLSDITTRKQAEAALREGEIKFRLLAENIQDVFWLCTAAFDRMLYVSPAFEKIWGRTCASLYQRPRSFADAIHPEDQGRLFAVMQEHAQSNWEVEYRIIRPDGSLRWILDRGFPIRDEGGTVTLICGVAKDITGHKQAEAALLASEARLRLSVRSANIGLWDWDRAADTV